MKLPFLDRLFTKEKENEYFITLEIKQHSVVAILLEKKFSNLVSHEKKEVSLGKNVNHLTVEELTEAADRAISQIEDGAPPGTFIKKTIFTVPYEWQDSGKVKREHLATLKKLCTELELTPIGFLVPIEAIIHAMQRRDGALSNVIFLEAEEKLLTVYIARAGAIVEIHRASQTNGIGDTAEELLRQVKSLDVLPGRIIVLQGSQSENLQQELVGRQWSQDIPFLHLPQVTITEADFENEAIIQGVAEQMKLNVAGGHDVQDESKALGTQAASAKDMGFHKDIDVAKQKPIEPFQFEKQNEKISSDNIAIHDTQEEISPSEEDETKAAPQDNIPQQQKDSATSFPASILAKIPNPFQATSGIPIGFKLLPLVVLLLLSLFVYLYYALLLQADVVLYADEKRTESQLPVVLSVSDSTSQDTIRIKVSEEEIEGSETTTATGEEITGEKATGEVTVFNKTESPASFSSGDTITTDDGLSFTLTDDIEVASTSAFSTSFSSKKVSVEAVDFGDDYNIEANTNFTFEAYSSDNYFAKNSDEFSGGTSEELTVVSEEDIANLEQQLLSQLQDEALEKAEDDISSKETIIPRIISATLTQKEFDSDVGDEAKNVTLNAVGVFEIGYYEDSEVSNFIKGASTEDVPEGYVFNDKGSGIDFEEIEVNGQGELAALAKVTAVHLPSIDKEELASSLSRKSATDAKNIIEEYEGTERFEIVYSRKLPFMPEFLPWNAENINVILKTE